MSAIRHKLIINLWLSKFNENLLIERIHNLKGLCETIPRESIELGSFKQKPTVCSTSRSPKSKGTETHTRNKALVMRVSLF